MTPEMQKMVENAWERRFDSEVLPLLNRYCLRRRQLRAAQLRADARASLAQSRDCKKLHADWKAAWAYVDELNAEMSDLYHDLNVAWDNWVQSNPWAPPKAEEMPKPWHETIETTWTKTLAVSKTEAPLKRALMHRVRERMQEVALLLSAKNPEMHQNTCGLREHTYDDFWDGLESTFWHWCGELRVTLEHDGMWRIYDSTTPELLPVRVADPGVVTVVEHYLSKIVGMAARAETQMKKGAKA